MAAGANRGPLELENDPEPIDWTHDILYGL
jgi:hypothetical protein